jgi:hypothetical protein
MLRPQGLGPENMTFEVAVGFGGQFNHDWGWLSCSSWYWSQVTLTTGWWGGKTSWRLYGVLPLK